MSNDLAESIITFVGVPLAVLGVLPILYNTLATLTALSKIKRMLRHGRLTALTRSDVVNRVIEVELPRYAVQPWDRFDQREEYWQISRQPSSIPGGSWTTFNWKTNTIGIKTQRVEYADQLRQPQVEVEFQELVAYLLDLGAIPDPHGWKLLRSTGLWTPMGCSLMKSPDTTHVALAIAPLDDSDGHLSLKVTWEPSWTTRDASKLPPYWISLPPPPSKEPEPDRKNSTAAPDSQDVAQAEDTAGAGGEDAEKKNEESMSKQSLDKEDKDDKREQKQAERNAKAPITCQFSVDGLQSALSQEQHQRPVPPSSSSSSSSTAVTLNVHSLPTEHLRASGRRTAGAWFASAATAYGTTSQTVLWNYKIPDEMLAFARRDTVPCGVLELLGVVGAHQTPQWESNAHAHDGAEELERFSRANAERRIAEAAEARMDATSRQIASQQRRQREMMQRMNEMSERSRRDAQRREARRHEALQSPKWDTRLVAEHNLAWLRARGSIIVPAAAAAAADVNAKDGSGTATTAAATAAALRDAVGPLLHRMVVEPPFAAAVCEMLDAWRAWADNGGMRAADLDLLFSQQEVFAQASLLVALVKDATGAHEGTLSMDLQECLRMWRIVRLG